ncbi:hypothetical protein D9M68_859900 [compost metagenome]
MLIHLSHPTDNVQRGDAGSQHTSGRLNRLRCCAEGGAFRIEVIEVETAGQFSELIQPVRCS